MKTQQTNRLLTSVMILLSVHLLYCNADLLIINEGGSENISNWRIFLLGVVAVSYSALSAISSVKIQQFGYVFVFGVLDAAGVLIQKYHNTDCIPWYFAVYTLWMIVMIWKMQQHHIAESEKAQQEAITAAEDTETKQKEDLSKMLATWRSKLNPYKGDKAALIAQCPNDEVRAMLEAKYLTTNTTEPVQQQKLEI